MIEIREYMKIDEKLLSKKPVFLFVGGYTGKLPIIVEKKIPGAEIHIYEADPYNFRLLQDLRDRMNLYNKAVVDYDGEIDFYRYEKIKANSIYSTVNDSPFREKITVPCISIKTAVNRIWKNIDVLVLNCEGSELKILDMIHREKLYSWIKQICVSFHNYNGGITDKEYRHLLSQLRRDGYKQKKLGSSWNWYLFRR